MKACPEFVMVHGLCKEMVLECFGLLLFFNCVFLYSVFWAISQGYVTDQT